MIATWKKASCGVLLIPFFLLAAWLVWLYRSVDVPLHAYQPQSLRIVIADPLCAQLARDYMKDHARREYGSLATFLDTQLHRPIDLIHSDDLADTLQIERGNIDLVIGQASLVSFAASGANETVRPLARLTDENGETNVCGLFVVRESSPARTIGDLADHLILFGPACEEERHAAALAALAERGVVPLPPLRTVASCSQAAWDVAKGDADALVIPSYAVPLLENWDAVQKGALRVLGRTPPVSFITVFATRRVSPATERAILDALLSVRENPPLLEALASKAGFVTLDAGPTARPSSRGDASPRSVDGAPSGTGWTDWRGPNRAGISPDVPTRLPENVRFLWRRGLTGVGLSGVAATATHVVVADKSEQNDQDIWRCLDADTGRELWTVAYHTPKEMEFTNAPRATPVIHGGFVYLLGAFGDLHCVNLYGSRIVWRRNIVSDFGARLPPWGMCSTPLIVDDSLIVNPGAPDASLVGLGLYTGEVVWVTPGAPSAYASLILGTFGGIRQIVGYDAVSLGGWDPNTGARLWTLVPEKKGDYNVPTPINADGRLLVATENNGTRLYDFDENGRIQPLPAASSRELAPDTSTPVVIDGLVFGCVRGLSCLSLDNGLTTRYSVANDEAFREYVALIAGNGHVLAVTVRGELVLLEATPEAFTPVSRLSIFKDAEVWSHPALVGNRLYLRSEKEVCCILLSGP